MNLNKRIPENCLNKSNDETFTTLIIWAQNLYWLKEGEM